MKAFVLNRRPAAGIALANLLVGTAVSSVLAAGMMTAIVTVKKSFSASADYADRQILQARIIDYISRDLRRALTVSVDTFHGHERLNLTIPDYYGADGAPGEPLIVKGGIQYGSGALPVSYYMIGDKFYRNAGGVTTVLAERVNDFITDFTDNGQQTVNLAITFIPKFRFSSSDTSTVREGTAAFASALLRNKRN